MSDEGLPPEVDPTSIGIMAMLFADLPQQVVDEAAQYQRDVEPDKRLGECLVEANALRPEQLDDLLARQQALRSGVADTHDVATVVEYVTRQTQRVGRNVAELARRAQTLISKRL